MLSLEKFREELGRLVAKMPGVEANLRTSLAGIPAAKPEAETEDKLLRPLLTALGFDEDHRTTQAAIRQTLNDRLGWVDYRLNSSPTDYKGLALLEAKPLLETRDLWELHSKQTRRYLRDYQIGLREREPVRWIVLTNFRELHVLNIADHEPFLKLTSDQYVANAELLYRLLNREQLIHDQITNIYYEKRRVPLGKAFLRDLKLWRLLLANGLRQSQPLLSLEEAKAISQQILDRIMLIRVLETQGLHPYYSLVRQYDNWQQQVRNHESFPFFNRELMRTFDDIEQDLNTDLFKDTLMEQIRQKLLTTQGQPFTHITLPNKYIRALVDPDVYWTDQDQDIRELIGYQTGQQRFTYSTPYNYDFHTLTQDIIGQVYEQFLAHTLVEDGQRILIRSDQSLRQREGTYYTPISVVNFVVEGTLGQAVQIILHETEQHLHEKRYQEAQASINTLKMLKVLDMACGSGTFLLASYEVLLKAYQWWNETLHSMRAKDFGEDWLAFLETGLRLERNPGDTILHNCIFGIDRDAQAIEVAKLNLWLLLLRTQPEDYARHGTTPPKGRLPDLSKNILAADALYPIPDIDALLGTGPQRRIILGNPPWGANMSSYGNKLALYTLARGQYDSYDVFIERATQCLRPGDLLGYVVPDSILQPPEHARLREFLLRSYQMDALIKLGEGIFEDVFRGAVAFQFTRTGQVSENHKVRCRIIVKEERTLLLKTSRENILQMLVDTDGFPITQQRFLHNKDRVFDIFASDEDETILQQIQKDAIDWKTIFSTGRGVEVSKTGAVMACSHCGTWQNIPRKEKNGRYSPVICINTACRQSILYEACTHATIIMPVASPVHTQPIIVGEMINRYQTLGMRYLDVSKVKYVPKCPNPDLDAPKKRCSYFDANAYPFVPDETRTCLRCGQTYTEKDVVEWIRLGVNYKSPDMYTDEKLLIRKTGRGIYATIDRTGAYTNQVVFIFKLKNDRPTEYQQLRLGYVLGVLNSHMMLYKYYKALGDIEWKSFPYMTQDTIMGLPIRAINFSNARQVYLHQRIADIVDMVIASGSKPNISTDSEIEHLVRELYEVNVPSVNARIDSELERIERFGSLLGSSGEKSEVEEE